MNVLSNTWTVVKNLKPAINTYGNIDNKNRLSEVIKQKQGPNDSIIAMSLSFCSWENKYRGELFSNTGIFSIFVPEKKSVTSDKIHYLIYNV